MNFLFRLVTLNSFTKEFKVGATNTKFVFENEGLNEAQVEIFQLERDQFNEFSRPFFWVPRKKNKKGSLSTPF
jgi:hypothetical protein